MERLELSERLWIKPNPDPGLDHKPITAPKLPPCAVSIIPHCRVSRPQLVAGGLSDLSPCDIGCSQHDRPLVTRTSPNMQLCTQSIMFPCCKSCISAVEITYLEANRLSIARDCSRSSAFLWGDPPLRCRAIPLWDSRGRLQYCAKLSP
jgi:hypothetical protein